MTTTDVQAVLHRRTDAERNGDRRTTPLRVYPLTIGTPSPDDVIGQHTRPLLLELSGTQTSATAS